MKKQPRTVPDFKSRKEEAEFWDSHSPLDYPEFREETDVAVIKPLRHERVLSIRMDESTLAQIEELARKRHLGKSTLARLFIVEGLDRISKTG
jgi:hypothetical protein